MKCPWRQRCVKKETQMISAATCISVRETEIGDDGCAFVYVREWFLT